MPIAECRPVMTSKTEMPERYGGPSGPPAGPSTVITSAPRSASSIVQYGPASTREKSATTMPDSGPEFDEPGAGMTLPTAIRTNVRNCGRDERDLSNAAGRDVRVRGDLG